MIYIIFFIYICSMFCFEYIISNIKFIMNEDLKKNWYRMIRPFQNSILFFVDQPNIMDVVTDLALSLNRPVLVFYDFKQENSNSIEINSNIIFFNFKFTRIKYVEESSLDAKYSSYYNYINTILLFIDTIFPEGFILFSEDIQLNDLFKEVTRRKKIPYYSYHKDSQILFSIDLNRIFPPNYLKETYPSNLHIGCGPHCLSGWLNTDINRTLSDVYYLDAARKFPFEDETFDFVFSEHLIEHLGFQGAKNMLCEVFRILKPGGVLRIATPDIRFLFELYLHREDPKTKRYLAWSASAFYSDVYDYFKENVSFSSPFIISYFFRNWGHQAIFDQETLSYMLRESGFSHVASCSVGKSSYSELCGLESHGESIPVWANEMETMVLEAYKDE